MAASARTGHALPIVHKLSMCLFVSFFVCLSACHCACLFQSLSACLSLCCVACLPVNVFLSFILCLPVCLSMCLLVSFFVCPSACHCVCLFHSFSIEVHAACSRNTEVRNHHSRKALPSSHPSQAQSISPYMVRVWSESYSSSSSSSSSPPPLSSSSNSSMPEDR